MIRNDLIPVAQRVLSITLAYLPLYTFGVAKPTFVQHLTLFDQSVDTMWILPIVGYAGVIVGFSFLTLAIGWCTLFLDYCAQY